MADIERTIEETLKRALACHQAGDLAQAETLYEAVRHIQPRHFDALHLLGVIAVQRLRYEEGRAFITQALHVNPMSASAHSNLGAALSGMAEYDAALRSNSTALAIAPSSVAVLVSLSDALGRLDRPMDALKNYDRALAIKPGHTSALVGKGGGLLAIKRHDHAIRMFDRALALDPGLADAWNGRGNAIAPLKQPKQALVSFDRALAIDPTGASAWNNRANALKDLQPQQGAVVSYRRALALSPGVSSYWSNLGDLVRLGGAITVALTMLERALVLQPTDPIALSNYGLTLIAAERLPAAFAAFRRAIALEPASCTLLANLADPFYYSGDAIGMRQVLKRALSIAADVPRVEFMLGISFMLTSELDRAWHFYERRFAPTGSVVRRPFHQRWWDGRHPVAGKLLVWAEQGFGDELIFSSMLPALVGADLDVVVEVDPRLVSIFARSLPSLEFVARRTPPAPRLLEADIVAQIAMGSLAKLVRPTLASFSRVGGFLVPDPELRKRYKARLAGCGSGLKVGIAWRSGLKDVGSRRFHTELLEWGPILSTAGVQFVNLQYGDCQAEREAAETQFGIAIQAFSEIDLFNDIEGALGLSSSLDLVISTGTSAYTMAAAAGIETWLLALHNDYFMLGRDDMPWFHLTRGFKRRPGESWSHAIELVGHALRERVDANRSLSLAADRPVHDLRPFVDRSRAG